jgi:hypothetical protein
LAPKYFFNNFCKNFGKISVPAGGGRASDGFRDGCANFLMSLMLVAVAKAMVDGLMV